MSEGLFQLDITEGGQIVNAQPRESASASTDDLSVFEMKSRGIWPLSWLAGKGLIEPLTVMAQKLNRPLIGLEIGVCRGENIVHLLDTVPQIGRVDCMDPFVPFQDWNGPVGESRIEKDYQLSLSNLQPYGTRVRFLRETSEDAWKTLKAEWYDWIFVDGLHTQENCLQDLTLYYPNIREGGLVAGHDYYLNEIREAVTLFRNQKNITASLQFCDTQAWYWVKA